MTGVRLTARPTLLGLSGSLRAQSHNTAILQTLAEAIRDRVDMRLLPIGEIPLYNEDHDNPPPAAVVALKRAIANADGLVIATPEYNHGMSGVLKNALDWASRPYERSVLVGKAALTITSSTNTVGGARAHSQLNETLAASFARVLLRPQAVVPNVHEKVAAGRLSHRPTLTFLVLAVDDLLREIGRSTARHVASSSLSTTAEPE